ncbi:MAG: GNAT family N-acetyltransferase [Gammaproteobacteria bacterium]|nr:GNAT family N-acetyltransferase [Gammaproteobacteria bacterium]
MIEWRWQKYEDLSSDELYAILRVRQQVFAVEQNCVYQDIDNLDKTAWHLSGWNTDGSNTSNPVAYLRVVYPTYKYDEPAIGRLLTVESVRKTGLGKALLKNALAQIKKEYPDQAVRISAQLYLQKFYAEFGFKQVSNPYNEDGIPHIGNSNN